MNKKSVAAKPVNINSNKANQFDAIVVGAGMSGGWAAKEFTEKGFNTLVLERGRDVAHGNYPTANMEPWTHKHGMALDPKLVEENPIVSKCYNFKTEHQDFFVKDKEQPYIQVKPFDWIRAYQVGGKSLLWARQVQRWGELDFKANAMDGNGVDWPIRYEDLAPWYSYVEKFIGVSGTRDGLNQIPDGEFLPPFEMNCVETFMKEKVENTFPGRNFIIGRTANITQRHNERGPCMLRNRCGRGCPYGAYYSSNSSTIPAAKKTGYMTLRPHSVVHSIIYDEQKQKAIGVRVIDANTKEAVEYFSKVIFLNAGTLNTNAILFNSKTKRFTEGLGNEHDVLGRYLMDHDYRGHVVGVHEGFQDKYYSGHRPTGCYVPRFRNINGDKQHNFVRGYAMSSGASRGAGNQDLNDASFGEGLKEKLLAFGPWGSGFGPMGEHLPYYENRVTLSKTQKDDWGMPLLELDCEHKENENKMLEDSLNTGAEMLEVAGFKNIQKIKRKDWNAGLSIHEMGGAVMGKDPKTSILNKFNQLHDVKNVFVSDGACMSSSACQNPSLTYMAMTARASNYAIDELKKGNL
ncbi:GMC family oxidoreductase [Flammeovirgaceae bacterium SG7u.111]|nr:GMC family oxidoreductase [Flammeovirgaceae bacterium SG7u.132]WPO37034.1 GMC family oxidoreductase [Flammeovirgaceae bacterium SG7u.111]